MDNELSTFSARQSYRPQCPSQCELIQLPPVTNYHKVLTYAGHYRRVVQLSGYSGKSPETPLGSLKHELGDDMGSLYTLDDKPLNCAFVSPIFSIGLDVLKSTGCGVLVNDRPFLGCASGNGDRENFKKATEKLQKEVENRSKQINELKESLNEASAKIMDKDEDIRRYLEVKTQLEREIQEAVAAAQSAQEMSASMQQMAAEAPVPEAVEPGENMNETIKYILSQISGENASEELLRIYNEYLEMKRRQEEATAIGIQSIKTFYSIVPNNQLSHGIEAELIVEDIVKEVRVRIDYNLKCLMVARSSKSRLISLSELDCLFTNKEQFEELYKAGYLSNEQNKNIEYRAILFGFIVPCVIQFQNKQMKETFCEQVNWILDAVAAEKGMTSQSDYECEQREKRLANIMEQFLTQKIIGKDVPRSLKSLTRAGSDI